MNKSNYYQSENVGNICLLITGCISPNKEQSFLFLKDIEERLKQYIDSILYYLRYSSFKMIVYCDNSNFFYDNIDWICSEAERHGKQFEWISFLGDDGKIVKCGKGYGEGEIIEYALENSKLLRESKAFFKVTGRLKVLNIDYILRRIKSENKNYFNRDIYSGRKGIDTRFYCVNTEFYRNNLLKVYYGLDVVNRSLENAFWDALKQKEYKNLPAFPKVDGISGGNGRNYAAESKALIAVFSFFCRLNIFNLIFPIYIGYRKMVLTLKRHR